MSTQRWAAGSDQTAAVCNELFALPCLQARLLEWFKIMIAPRPGCTVDGFGFYTGGSRVGANICVRWSFIKGEFSEVLRHDTYSYKCAGGEGQFELLKVPYMSTMSPSAMLSGARSPSHLGGTGTVVHRHSCKRCLARCAILLPTFALNWRRLCHSASSVSLLTTCLPECLGFSRAARAGARGRHLV